MGPRARTTGRRPRRARTGGRRRRSSPDCADRRPRRPLRRPAKGRAPSLDGMERAERSRFTLVAMSLGFAVVQLDVSVVNVAIRPIGDALGGGVAGLQWIVNAYTITFAAFILSAGAVGDRIGARRVFVAGFALFTAASAMCGLAPSLGALVAARAVQGIGAAVLVPCSLILLNHAYREPHERAR